MRKKTWTWRKPIIKFSINPLRKNLKKSLEPVKRSKYAQSLWDEGAGWRD